MGYWFRPPVTNGTKNNILSDVIGSKLDNESGDSLYAKSYIVEKHQHGRNRSYPFFGAGITLTGAAGAGLFGAYAEIIPVLANEVNTLTVTHAADSSANVNIFLNGTCFTKAVSTGDINAVAAQLRGYTYADIENGVWTVTGADAEVIFTRPGISTTATFADVGTTGVTATIAKTNTGAGIAFPFDIHVVQGGIANKKDTYILELCSGLANYENRIGNIRISTEADNSAAGMIPMMSRIQPAGTRISARIASLTGGSDTLVVSLMYHIY